MNRTRSVFIRADGSKAIGMGHLSRAHLIAEMLRSRFATDVKIIMRRDPLAEMFARKKGFDLVLFDAPSVNDEMGFLEAFAQKEKPRLLILDVLENDTDPSYMRVCRQFSAPIVAVTDDSSRRTIDADIIVNGNPAQTGLNYDGQKGRYLLGPKYFLMDDAYAQNKRELAYHKAEKLLISLGASDHHDLLFKLLGSIKGIERDMALVLVISSASGYVERLKDFLTGYPKKYDLYVDAPNLVPFWEQVDLAVTAGGNTLFERIASRVPGATLCQLQRQMEIADSFERLGLNYNLGFGPGLGPDMIQGRLEKFLEDKVGHQVQFDKSPQFVDGKGLRRLADVLEPLLKGV
ncbi:MAG: hypothetical protein KA403_02540 [Candidatus Omnitrophica bacterium]|nr:hypothetical protein [Candidatus Omnitrophota bacterium]